MDYLIITEKDVSLREKAEIIMNDISDSDKEVLELFNNLDKFVNRSSDLNVYFEQFNDINKALLQPSLLFSVAFKQYLLFLSTF